MNQKQYSVSIIGAGNVAWHFAKKIHGSVFFVKAISSRDIEKAKLLADKVSAQAVNDLNKIPQSDIYLLSIKDDAYASVISSLPKTNSIYLHTSGSLEMNVLEKLSLNYGVLYPFQTFSKGKELDFDQVPLCLEASNIYTEQILLQLAEKLSEIRYWLTSYQRAYLHLAGVFACNFPNALYVIVKQILEKQQIDFSIAIPLIKETVAKLDYLPPKEAQTGPAIRDDKKIMEKHLEMLSDEDYKNIYQLLSKVIQKQQNIK